MQDYGVGISIGIALRGLSGINSCERSFNKLRNAISKAGNSVKHLRRDMARIKLNNPRIEGIEKNMDRFKSKAMEKLAFAGSAILPVKLSMDFESAMADVKKVVDFANDAEMSKFSNEILNLARSIPLSANELATITASGGQLGIAKENLLEFTKITAKMSTAFDMSADDAGYSIASMMNVYNIGIERIEALGDTINHLSDNSAAKARDIVEAMKRIGGSAKVFGLTEHQSAALASSFIALGKPPQVAATAINALLNKLATAPQQGAKFQEALQGMGIDASYLKTAIQKDPQKALEIFLGTLEGIPKGEMMSVLTSLFGAEYSDDMALLASSLSEYRKALNLTRDEGKDGSMQREFENRAKTTANAMQLMKNSIVEIGVNFGSLFLPAISRVFKAISTFSAKLSDFVKEFPTLSKVVSSAFFAFATFSVVLPTIGFLINGLMTNVLALKNAYSYLKIALTLSAKALMSLSMPSLENIKMGLKLYAVTIKDTTARLSNAVALKAQAFSMWLVSARLKTAIVLTSAYSAASKALAGTMTILRAGVLAGAGAMKILRFALIGTGIGALVVGIGMAASWLIENWDKVKAFFSNIWESIKPYWQATTQFFSDIWQRLSDFLSTIFSPVINVWNNLFGGFFDWISQKFAWVSDIISSIGDITGKVTNWTKDTLGIGDGKESTWYNPLSWFNNDTAKLGEKTSAFSSVPSTIPSQTKSAAAMTANGGAININFSGGINIATNNGKFDMSEFERQLVVSVKRALKTDEMNAKNRDIRGQ